MVKIQTSKTKCLIVNSSTKSLLKTAGIVVGVIILLGIAIYAVTGYFLEPYVRDKITNKLQKVNGIMYDIIFDRLDIQAFGGNIYMENVQIVPVHDPSLPASGYKLLLDKLSIEGLNVHEYVFSNELDINNLKLENPKIVLYKYIGETKKNTSTNTVLKKKGIKKIENILIDKLNIISGSLQVNHVTDTLSRNFLSALISIEGKKIKYNAEKKDFFKALKYSELKGTLSDVEIFTKDSLRVIKVKNINIDGDTNFAVLNSIKILSRHDKYKIGQVAGHEVDWMEINIPEVRLENLLIEPLLINGSINTSQVSIQQPEIEIFRDRRLPSPESKKSQLPAEFLKDMERLISIDSIEISGGNISYSEHVKGIEEPGTVTFNKLDAIITNVSNDSATLAENDYTGKMHITTMFMNKAKLDADFTFDYTSEKANSIKGSVGAISHEVLNPIAKKIGYAIIESGKAHSLDFNFTYDKETSNGEAKLIYENLEITFLSKEGEEKEFKSFIGDFAIDDENIGDDIRIGKIYFERNKKNSVLNYWWKSLYTGILNSIGAEAKAEKLNAK